MTGPCQAGRCGVGDYTQRLAEALHKAGLSIEVLGGGDWSLARLPSLVRLVRRTNADVFHIQYPTSGFGHKLGPQGVALALPSVLTIHEASRCHILRKLSLYPFAVRPQHIIFTTEEERCFALRWAPWVRNLSSVVPIGSNVTPIPCQAVRSFREIIYFGLIMPRKGLEDVLALGALIKHGRLPLTIRIVGNHRPEHSAYAENLHLRSAGLPIIWEEGLDAEQVGCRLASAWIAYLPFPDGASEGRTSLKAALASGMAVVTTPGPAPPQTLEPAVKFCSAPTDALSVIRELITNPPIARKLGEAARQYAVRFNWEECVRKHVEVYRKVLAL